MVTAHLRTATPRFSAEDRRQQILVAATELFAGKGFRGTTTREIAELAKVNESIIFRHFQTKEDLYSAVIEHVGRNGRTRWAIEEYADQDLPVEEVFRAVAREFLATRERNPSLGRLLLFGALEHQGISERLFRTHMATLYEGTVRYIRRQIEAGRLREVDPTLAARAFWGMVVYHFVFEELLGAHPYPSSSVEDVSRTLADVWLDGMLPRARRGRKKKISPHAASQVES